MTIRRAAAGLLLLALAAPNATAATPPDRSYYVYVCAESDDEVALVRYGPDGLSVVRTIGVGRWPAETEGPHGITVDPGGRHWYVTLAHGAPFGRLSKYATGSDRLLGEINLGLFPATLDVSPATGLVFVVNFDLHGPRRPSTISVVDPETMTEVQRIGTGVMPHGSRFSRDGHFHYSVNMMSGELVEVDGLVFSVRRVLALAPHAGEVQPTWVTRPTAAGTLYVTGYAADRIFAVDVDRWQVTHSFEAGSGPYNLAVSSDGAMLLATYKQGAAIGFWDLAAGRERFRTATSRAIPHGVVLTPDDRFAFVTLEGVGHEPGTVEVYHAATGARMAAVDLGKQAGGIAFWKVEP